MATFKDYFSDNSADYARARPTYPAELFDWLAQQAPSRRCAWDCATGSGQAALELAGRFDRVIATDASAEQLRNAFPHPKVSYHQASAEHSELPAGSVSLVTVAQAVHWFDRAAFWAEARRVLEPGGVIAVWAYALCSISPEIDARVSEFYMGEIGPFWPPERKVIDQGYVPLDFPFRPLEPPPLHMGAEWPLPRFLDYLRTWSAVRRYVAAKGSDPVPPLGESLAVHWGDPSRPRAITWPLILRVGKI